MSARWNITKLLNVAYIASGQGAPQSASDFNDTGIPFVRAGSLDSLIQGGSESDCERITEQAARKYGLKLFAPGTILFAKSGMSAKLGRIYQLKSNVYVVNHLAAVVPSDVCDSTFLKYWFQANSPSRLIKDDSYPSIRLSDIEEIEILLPPLNEQRRIAAILDKADAIRRKRQVCIGLTEEFLHSIFLEIFGDPVTNPKGWKVKTLSEVCDVRDGTHDSPQYVQNGYPLITSKNLRNGYIDFSEVNLISEEDYIQINKRSAVDQGDIIMPMIGTIGNPVLVEGKEKFAIKNVALIKFTGASINNRYLLNLLRSSYFDYLISRINRGGTQKFIALSDIRDFPVPIPDERAQQEFSAISQKIKQLNEKNTSMTIKANNLFDVLTQRAFRGELS